MENRRPVISREYERGAHKQGIFIYLLTGPQITGTLYRLSELLDNVEQEHRRFESGNKYEIRKRFLNHLMDLDEEGWKRVTARTDDPEHSRFSNLSICERNWIKAVMLHHFSFLFLNSFNLK